MIDKLAWYLKTSHHGIPTLLHMQMEKRIGAKIKYTRVTSKYVSNLVFARTVSSDLGVFYQIFMERENHCLDSLQTCEASQEADTSGVYQRGVWRSDRPSANGGVLGQRGLA
jgi:hypothetical protein